MFRLVPKERDEGETESRRAMLKWRLDNELLYKKHQETKEILEPEKNETEHIPED